jgi:hypothetical protein
VDGLYLAVLSTGFATIVVLLALRTRPVAMCEAAFDMSPGHKPQWVTGICPLVAAPDEEDQPKCPQLLGRPD